MRVLVVDDDPGIRETLRALLEEEGYAVSVASDGEDGLAALLASADPVVTLLDLLMPNMSGEEMLDALLTHYANQPPTRLAFIVITANERLLTPHLREMMRAHNIPVEWKPFNTDRLLASIAEAAARVRNLVTG